jgi:hypothetical protein
VVAEPAEPAEPAELADPETLVVKILVLGLYTRPGSVFRA